MSNDPEATAPPVQQSKWQRLVPVLQTIWGHIAAHPDLSIALALIVAAFFLGRCTA